jgi:two-component system, OmpR family, phosphate regulon sensor histidine kinase PhoR
MRGKHSLLYHILIFIVAQIVWLSLLGIWIYWYVSNYIVFEKVGDQVSPQLIYDAQNAAPFILGLILLIGLSVITALIFRNLNVQLRLTELYDNFIGNVTHELKSPLASIQLHLETLKKRDVPPGKQIEFVEMMTKDADRLQRLINSILEISAHEKKKIIFNYQVFKAEITVKKLFEESFEKFRVEKGKYQIIGKAPCEIVAGKDALKIVFDNLADNAVKYSIDPVNIKIRMSCNSNKFILDFSDDGIGIPSKEQKKIFKKFYRIYDKEIPNVKGTGLGLYWVKEIINAHGGTISISNNEEGKGTTFRIELPVYGESKKRLLNKLLKKT